MSMRAAGRLQWIGIAALTPAFVLASLASGAAIASDVERQIPVIRATAGSGMTLEISREGTRQTATPFFTLNDATVQRVEKRIGKMFDRLAAKEIPPEVATPKSLSLIGLTGTPREDSTSTETTLSSLPPVPGEITVRSVKRFLKGLRASRKEKPAPAVAVAVPEQRPGMAVTSRR
jgi:hypothetical protein